MIDLGKRRTSGLECSVEAAAFKAVEGCDWSNFRFWYNPALTTTVKHWGLQFGSQLLR